MTKLYNPYPYSATGGEEAKELQCSKRGVSSVFSIDMFRGKCSADPKKVTKYLLSKEVEENRVCKTSHNIMFQDHNLPTSNPDSSLLSSVMVDIVNKLSKAMDRRIKILRGWTIIHHYQYQTAPHTHMGNGIDLACVYWAQVPEGSGHLSCYPLGLPGPHTLVKATEGEFLVFPSDLVHGVTQNVSDEPRVSMSFNLQVLPKL